MMSAIHPKPISEKLVRELPAITHLIDVLKNIVSTHGLSGDIITPVIPTQKITKSQLITRAKNNGWYVPGFLDDLTSSHYYVFEKFTPAFDSANLELYDRYDKNLAIQLLANTHKTAAEIASLSTDSHKLTIAEIYTRLVIQALRGDNLHALPPGKDRFVWLDILKVFHRTIMEGRTVDIKAVELEDKFRDMLTNIAITWSPTLKEAVHRLTDTERGARICSATGLILAEMKAYLDMVLICELTEKKDEDNNWSGYLTQKMASIKLAQIEESLIRSKAGKTHYSFVSLETPITDLERLTDLEGHDVTVEKLDLVSLGWLTLEQAKNQLIICDDIKKDNNRVRSLYALKNRIETMRRFVLEVGSMIGVLTFMPYVMEKIPFHQMDAAISNLRRIFRMLIDKEKHIDTKLTKGRELHNQMLGPIERASNLTFDEIGKFRELNSSEWLDKVSSHCMFAVNNVITLGKINKCEVFPVGLKALMKRNLPTTHDVWLRIEAEEKEEKHDARSGSKGISCYLAQASFAEQELKVRKLLHTKAAVAPVLRQVFTLHEPYIRRYLMMRGIFGKVDYLYNAFRHGEQIDFMEIFASAYQKFTDKNPLAPIVKALAPLVRSLVKLYEGKEYVFRLKSKQLNGECAADVIYIQSNPDGLSYEVLGPDNKVKQNTIKWDKLSAHFPRVESEILRSGDVCFPEILTITTENGHTERRAMRSQVLTFTSSEAAEEWYAETELLFMLKFLSVEAVIMGFESYLIHFIEIASQVPQHKRPTRYEMLIQKIAEEMTLLTSKPDYEPYFTPKGLPETLISANEALKAEVEKLTLNEGALVEVTESKSMELAERKADIQKLKEVLSERERVDKEKDKAIKEMETVVSKQKATILEKDEVIAEQKSVIAEQKRIIEEQEKALAAKEMSNQDERDALIVKKRHEEELSALARTKDAKIESIIEKAKDKIKEVKQQAQQEKERYEAQIIRLVADHAEVSTENDELKKEIAALKERLQRESAKFVPDSSPTSKGSTNKSGSPTTSGLYSKSLPNVSSSMGEFIGDRKEPVSDSEDKEGFVKIPL